MIAQIQYNGQQVTVSVDWQLQFSGDYHIKAVYLNGNDITGQLNQEQQKKLLWEVDKYEKNMDHEERERKMMESITKNRR